VESKSSGLFEGDIPTPAWGQRKLQGNHEVAVLLHEIYQRLANHYMVMF